MKNIHKLFPIVFLMITLSLGGCQESGPKVYKVLISTPLGDMEAILYNETPLHRDNFLKLTREGFYDGTLFHRCIDGFMIQGGDPQSKFAKPGQVLGGGEMGYTIDPEIGKIHKKGALSAARLPDQVNPDKKSSGSQFFIVQGGVLEPEILTYFTTQKGRVYTSEEQEIYTQIGGRPDLDMEYSVFGEITSGFDVLDKILAQQVDPNNRPYRDIPMEVKILND